MANGIFIGNPRTALTSVNRFAAQLEANVGTGVRKRKRRFHKFVCGGPGAVDPGH